MMLKSAFLIFTSTLDSKIAFDSLELLKCAGDKLPYMTQLFGLLVDNQTDRQFYVNTFHQMYTIPS